MKTVDIEGVFRAEAGRALATLIRLVGDFEYAEDALQDAFAAAAAQWPREGVPHNPRAWLVEVGRRKAIDRIAQTELLAGQAARACRRRPPIDAQAAPDDPDEQLVADDMLRLIFTCCHPALNMEAQVALTLRAVCGLATAEIARAFLVGEETMAQRLVRAKAKIRTAKIPYETPNAAMLDERVDGVLATIYLVFTEGYAPTDGLRPAARRSVTRGDPAWPPAASVDAAAARRAGLAGADAAARCAAARARPPRRATSFAWKIRIAACGTRAQIVEGAALVEQALRAPGVPSPYAVQAAIAALHAQATSYRRDRLASDRGSLRCADAAAAVARDRAQSRRRDIDGRWAAGRAQPGRLARRARKLAGYHLLPAVRADLLVKLNRNDEAKAAYRDAIALAKLDPERRWLEKRLAELG